MANSLWPLFVVVLAVLFTRNLVSGKRIHLSTSTKIGTQLLSLADAERTNYTLLYSGKAKILRNFLYINSATGVVTLNRNINCEIFYNKIFVVAVRSTSVRPPRSHFFTIVYVILHNRHGCPVDRFSKSYVGQKYSSALYNNDNLRNKSLFNNYSGILSRRSRLKDQLASRNGNSNQFLYKLSSTTKSVSKESTKLRSRRDIQESVWDYSSLQTSLDNEKDTGYRHRVRRSTKSNAPKFAKLSDLVTVREDVNISTVVYIASASDTNIYQKLVYSMNPRGNIRSLDFFEINPSTGKIKTKALLDRETLAQHQFRVSATGTGNPPLQATMVLTIEVTDVNDHAPVFDKKVYRENISEEEDSGSTVLAVRAYDSDIGPNKAIRYSIVNRRGENEVFIIDKVSGIIRVDDDLDREKVPMYHLVVKAEDQGKPPQSSTVDVFINLLDENDCTPEFNQSFYSFLVAENSPRETIVGRINATDCDIGLNQKIRYSITIGNEDLVFKILQNSGVILVQGLLDYETKASYTLQVTAEDSGEVPEYSEVWVQIDVTDVNDFPPKFTKDEYRFSVFENKDSDTVVGDVRAEDRDLGKNAEVEYFIRNKNVPFRIGLNSGKIKTAGKLDREKVQSYQLEVIAQDKGKVPLRNSVKVYIDVDDVNDSPPVFEKSKYNATIDEKYSSRRSVLTVRAKDVDTIGQIKYSIKDEPFNCFAINSYGSITKLHSCTLNYKTKKVYYFKVEASDGLQSTSVPVIVRISDANDNSPEFTKSRYTGQIYENDTAGTTVVKVKATDDDFGKNAEITYSILGRNKFFTIDAKSGVITNVVKLDREVTPKFKLKVSATDNGKRKRSGRTRVDIKVKDINDNMPRFDKSLYKVELDENVRIGKLVIQIKATDEDVGINKQISYSLEKKGNINTAFIIDKDLGDITVNKNLDREITPEYLLTVVATDHGNPAQHSTTQVKVTLRDVIDSPPKFVESRYVINIKENFPLKKELVKVQAVTRDIVKHARIQYDITNGNYDNMFTILGSTGSIELVESLDYERKTRYLLTVQAIYESYLASAEVEINVLDVNDNLPILARNFEILINTREGRFPGNVNFRIPAYDPDKNDQLTYKILLKNERAKNAVTVNRDTGVLSIKESALANTHRIEFKVIVSDGLHVITRHGSINLNIITDQLLQASAPVYLKNTTASKFFAALTKFKSAVEDIMDVKENSVVVFYVVNTTRTYRKFVEGVGDILIPDNFLTAWFAVRSGKGFIHGKLVLEKLFFDVKELEEGTGITVLPSDKEIKKGLDSNHHLLVQEACKTTDDSYFTCTTNKSFADAPGQLLFTPSAVFFGVKIREVLRRVCSAGYYGTSCNLRLDACYSSPCMNKGKCVDYEGGFYCACAENFVGKICEFDVKKSKCSNLPDNICENKGACQDNSKQGFGCQCQNDNYEGKLCRVTTRSFENGSFAAFSGLNQRWHIEISLEFATVEANGVLLYIGRYGHENDSMALELRDGKLYYVFSAGDEAQTVSVGPGKGESIVNGNWQKVSISYQQQTGALVLGENCKSAVAVKFGNQIGNFSCAAARKLKGKLRSMDLTSPLLLGGLSFTPTSFPIQGHSFIGCIRNVKLNHAPLDLGSPIFDENTRIGCSQKRDFCRNDSCSKNGKCVSSWDRATCVCREEFAGKTCEIKTISLDFTSKSFLVNKFEKNVVKLPWTTSVVFRTVEKAGTLMQLVLGNDTSLLKLEDGNIHFIYDTLHLKSKHVVLDDGWHHVDITWTMTLLCMVVDHVHKIEVNFAGGTMAGKNVAQVALGDMRKSGNGFIGCMKGVMIGASQLNIGAASRYLVTNGCGSKTKCESNSCPRESVCKAGWRKTSCACRHGYVGEKCRDVCSLRPCQNGATCQRTNNDAGFKCICPDKYLGQFCETRSQLPCRDEFFSASDGGTCGPCNCELRNEYNPVCNKTTGECYCKEGYFRAFLDRGKLDEVCDECRCDSLGSASQMCEPIGGQCPCLPGVIGRVCDMCQAKQGEITQNGKGCKIINTSCPRAKAERIVWPREHFGVVAVHNCPYGAEGKAKRLCAFSKGWQEPDLSNCTSRGFVNIVKLLKDYGNLTTETAIIISHKLWNMFFSWKEFYQSDVALGYKIIIALLDFESNQVEDKLASSQDKKFLDILLKAVSIFVDVKYTEGWSWIKENPPATVSLMRQLEEFGISLASNMVYIKRKDYRGKRSTTPLPSYNKVEENLLMQLEPVNPKQFSGLTFPLAEHETNLLLSEQWRNTSNRVKIPASLFQNPGAPKDESAIAFIALKYLGDLLPYSFDTKASFSDLSLDVNSDVIIVGIKGMENVYLKHPITIEFEIHEVNRSQYDCVFWNYSVPGRHGGGWSRNGCTKAPSNFTHTVCKCHHLTSFAVVSDLRIEIPVISPYTIQIVTYVGVAVSLAILLVAVISFTCLSGLNSNTNNIHRNMVMAIVIAEVVYVFGINRTSNQLICRFVAITLHYFFDAVFAWMFVEVIHMYRRLTEKRDIDSGQMTFYYFLGWGCPAIVVGLSTGMAVEGYGNKKFCWMTTNGTLIWTFTLPIAAVMFANMVVFLMALRLSVQKARRKRKHQTYNVKNVPVTSVHKNALKIKYALKVGAMFLPVLGITLTFAVLAVNQDLLVFHYLYAVLCCCQSLFVLLFYVAFDPKVREEYKNAFIRWKSGDKTYGRPRRRRLYEMSYHPGSNLAGEDGYGLRGMNPETTSTDRSTSTLHSTSMTKTDPFSTFPEDDSESDYKEIKKRKPRKNDPVDMESAAKMWNAPEKSEVSTTQPESSDTSGDERRKRTTIVISSESGTSEGEGSGSWEKKSENGVHKPKVTAPLYASDGPMHSTPLELEQEKARLLTKKPLTDTPVATVEPLPRPKIPSILKNSTAHGTEAEKENQPSPQPVAKPVPEMSKAGSEASSGSSLSSLSEDDNDLVAQAKLLSQSTEGGMSTTSSQAKKRRSRKHRDIQHGKKSRHHRVHFNRKNPEGAQKSRVKTVEEEEGKRLTEAHV